MQLEFIGDDVDGGIFTAPLEHAEQKKLFKKYVRNITLEVFDYCNRKCTYCPVSLVDRQSQVQLMPDAQFDKIVADLVEIDFDRSICLNLYNEPLAHERTFTAARQLAEALPKARVWFNTNGDYLNAKVMERIADAGIQRIVITLHLAANAKYDDKHQLGRLSQISARTGLMFNITKFRPDIDYRAEARFKKVDVTLKSVDYSGHGVNRGGAMEHIPVTLERTAPCNRPFHDMTIAWNGNVYPCCQFMDGLQDHEAFIVGNVAEAESLYELYCSNMMASFRRDTFGYGPKRPPCDSCADQAKCRGEEDQQQRRKIGKRLGI